MRLLLQDVGLVEVLVNVTLHVRKFFRRIFRVTLEDNLVLVPTLHKLAEVERLVDVVRLLHRELRQSLLVVRMEVAWVNEEPLGEDVFSKLILGDHALDSVHQYVLGLALKHMLHRCGL